MKRNWFKTSLAAMAGILSIALLVPACSKDNDTKTTPLAGLMVFNLAPDKSAVSFKIAGGTLNNAPMAYSQYTGFYLDATPGSGDVTAFENTATTFASAPFNFADKKYYSVFLMGNNGTYRNVVVLDNIDTLTARGGGKAYVRFVNAIPDSSKPTATLTLQGNNLSSGSTGFGAVTQFATVIPGDVLVTLSGGISTSRTITLEAKKIYTVLLQGVPGHTDPLKAVQIKLIANGQVE